MTDRYEAPGERRHLKSINEYLDALAEHDDLARVDAPVDLNLELGAGARYAFENNLPAQYFTNITGFPGYRFLGGLAPYSSDARHRWGRVALALGLPWNTHPLAILDRLLAVDFDTDLIAPVVVPDRSGRKLHDTVDLYDIPSPMLHEGDGGDYLNTIGTMIATTPDGSWTNWHVCRVMRVDAQRLTIWTRDFQHFGMIYEMWKEVGKPMEFALALGVEPAATVLSGGRAAPEHVDEAAFLGGWFGEPLEVTRAFTVDHNVPATAQVVIEGHINIEERAPEGPMGEYPGYLIPDAIDLELVGHVTAISSVPEPILATVPAGKPVDDDHTINHIGQSAVHTRTLRDAGLPVEHVWVPPEGANQFAVVTVTKDWQASWYSDAQALIRRITDTLIERVPLTMALARILVVENDIDPTDLRDVMWALASRVRPGSDLVLTDRPLASLSPLFSPHERETFRGPLVVHNGLIAGAATRSVPSTFQAVYPEAVKAKIENLVEANLVGAK